jgi:catechol 2,3-dioxygenase-like lactoylglutathione lyase family enzyme
MNEMVKNLFKLLGLTPVLYSAGIKHASLFVIIVSLFQIESFSQDLIRPPILGIAHVSYKVGDINKAREFYGKFLGYEEAFTYYNKDGSVSVTFFKVNDRQYIEITPTLIPGIPDRLNHICFETTDIELMRQYLASKGIKVPDKLITGRDRNLHFTVSDPNGHVVEFVQIIIGSDHNLAKGKFLNDIRISDRIPHLGVTVKNIETENKFYKDILDFSEIWRGGITDSVTSYVNMKIPESTDYIEYMIVDDKLTEDRLHSAHHICLAVPDLQKTIDKLLERSVKVKMDLPKIGRNNRWLLNMYDADGTRIELMEPHTFK